MSKTGSLTGASQEWAHAEHDSDGRLVATYRSWLCESSSFIDTGYEKRDATGVLVEKGTLPPI